MDATQTPIRVGHPQPCSRCGSTVAWARTASGKNILMDFHPAPLGDFVVVGTDDAGHPTVAKMRVMAPGEPRFMCHFDTCTNARAKRKAHRYRRRLTPAQQEFKDAWDARARR